ncbi:MAG: hypothetical protein M5U34_25590 [Chloroflexi bacterium]|nr:hypothetical protein [Chloroflexota bacterium]
MSRVAFAAATAIVLMMAITFFLQPNRPFSRLMLFWAFFYLLCCSLGWGGWGGCGCSRRCTGEARRWIGCWSLARARWGGA